MCGRKLTVRFRNNVDLYDPTYARALGYPKIGQFSPSIVSQRNSV